MRQYRPNRLGVHRRNLRDYSLHQRRTGKTCTDRLRERLLVKVTALVALHARRLRRLDLHNSARRTTKLVVCLMHQLAQIRRPRLCIPDPIAKRIVTIEGNTEQECVQRYGFTKNELYQVRDALHIPHYFVINEGQHRHRVPGEKCLLYTLYRYHSPSQRMSLDTAIFGFDYSTLSKMFSVTVKFIHDTNENKLRNLNAAAPKLAMFNAKILAKIITTYPNLGIPYDATNCALFADGMRVQIARPSGEYYRQRAYYSGHKKKHVIGVQCVCGPDGILYDTYDTPVGRHQDRHFMSESHVNERMQQMQQGLQRQFWVYCDKGYNVNTHIRAAAHGPGVVTAQDRLDNYILSQERVGVEWCFGKVRARCPYIDTHKKMKLQEFDVRQRVRVAVLLTNIHTCLHQSQTGLYFNCMAPTLVEYLA